MKDPDHEVLYGVPGDEGRPGRMEFWCVTVPLTDAQGRWVKAESLRLAKSYGRPVMLDEVMRRALNHYLDDLAIPIWRNSRDGD